MIAIIFITRKHIEISDFVLIVDTRTRAYDVASMNDYLLQL